MIIHTVCGHESDKCNYSFSKTVKFNTLCWDCLKAFNGKEVDFIRFGSAPEDGFSYNYSEGKNEVGVSAYLVQNDKVVQRIRSEFVSIRPMFIGRGIVTGFGGDGEICVKVLKIKKSTKRDRLKLAESLTEQGYGHIV